MSHDELCVFTFENLIQRYQLLKLNRYSLDLSNFITKKEVSQTASQEGWAYLTAWEINAANPKLLTSTFSRSIPGRVIPKTFKMVLDTSLLNTQQYKVRIKDKVEQPRVRCSALPYTLV